MFSAVFWLREREKKGKMNGTRFRLVRMKMWEKMWNNFIFDGLQFVKCKEENSVQLHR